MQLFHGSRTGGIKVLEPRQADHDRPYVYTTTNRIVALLYLCNAVEKPYYWFPYGFNKDGVPVYHELYPNALREVSEGISGCPVSKCTPIENAYEAVSELIERGELIVDRFEDKTPEQLDWWYNGLCEELKRKNMKEIPDCSYAKFVQKKLPEVWARYMQSI